MQVVGNRQIIWVKIITKNNINLHFGTACIQTAMDADVIIFSKQDYSILVPTCYLIILTSRGIDKKST